MSLPFFHRDRLEKHISELASLRYRDIIKLDDFIATRDAEKAVNTAPLKENDLSFIMKVGEFWSGRDEYLWLKKEIQLDEGWNDKEMVGVFDFGTTGIGNNSSFESLLYLNDVPYQGVDSNHKEVFFDLKKTGSKLRLDFRLWSGLEGGGEPQVQYHQIKEAFIAWLDKETDDLYFTGKNIIDTLKILDDNDYHKHNLEKLLLKTMQMVDFTNEKSQEFYNSVKKAASFLNNELDTIEKESNINVFCVGHTHIDVAWLWRLKHTREKAARSFSTVNRLMEKYNDYKFLQTQAQLYEYIKTDFPEIYSDIQKRVEEGKWEPSGSMWVEADCNLTSGESLVRQILFGKRFFKKEFNYENTFLWLPDVFGYSWALPQILKKSNIDTFITTKISWNEINRMPYDTFIWRGIDGSEVITHFITTPDVCGDTKFYTYNGNILPKIVKGVWDNYRNKDLNQDMLISYGYGDGGGGVNRNMLENKRRIKKIPGLPNIITSNVTDYLKTVHNTINDKDNNGYLHIWDNELYLEFHRGTYTSQAYNKKMNRFLELKYRDAEILQVLTAILSGTWEHYKADEFEEGWKIILRNQFHDIIPGSSINEVYQDSKEEYQEAHDIVEGIIDYSFGEINDDNKEDITVLNTASWKRKGLISVPVIDLENYHYEDHYGNFLPAQIDKECIKLHIDNLSPISFGQVKIKEGKAIQRAPFKLYEQGVESDKYIIEWNESGQLTKIIDKKLNRNALTGCGNVFEVFEDKPRMYDAWEMEPTIDLKKTIVDDFKGVEVVSEGSNYIKLQFEWNYNKTTIKQYLVLYSHSGRIDFKTTVDWQERDKLMKVAFPVDVRSTKARYDIQYGNVERPTHRSSSWDFAKFEVVGHQWADLSEKGFGVALLNNCKYGYDIKDNIMRLSLLKSARYPDPEADRGIQQFTYSIYIHEEEWYDSDLIKEAWDLNASLLSTKGYINNYQPFFKLDNPSIVIDAIKKSEDGNRIILRLHEAHGGKSELEMKINFKHKGWYEVDLMENIIDELQKDSYVRHTVHPYEIFTIMIEI